MKTAVDHLRLSTADVIERYFEDRESGDLISVTDVLQVVRTLLPWCELTDAELSDVIARHALLHRCNVSFDRLADGPSGAAGRME